MDFAVDAALWVVGKALAPVTDGLLESWAASAELGPNIDALKMQLLYAQGMLDNAQDRDFRSPALKEMLHKLRQLAYAADDVLDELDYFRIQDALDGTYHATDAGNLVLNARHAARAVDNKLKVSSRSREDLDDQEDGGRQGCLSIVRPCGGRENRSSSSPPTNQGGQEVGCGYMCKVIPRARNAARTIGKHFPCYSIPSVCDNNAAHTVVVESSNMTGGAWPSKARKNNHVVQTSKLKFDRVEMSTKIMEIVGQLKPLCAMVSTILDKELLGLAILKFGCNHTSIQNSAANRPKTTPKPERDELYGRDIQKKEIVDGITHGKFCTNKLTVLSLVGPGGIGKTTLAQHIYRELDKSLSFDVSVWICVSLDFNADRLAQEILKKIPEVNDEDKKASIENLIEQRLKSKRLLLVLDDMWTYHEDEWEKLLAPLRYTGGEKNNVVIVTTRIPQVATMVSPTNSSIDVERLGPEDIKSFFQVCVFGDEENPWKDHLELEDIGIKIVSNLKGFPLAAKTVGRLLRNKLTLEHWTRVAESKDWELQTGPDDIMPALKLSYDYLPFHLQQCFFYFALFPEDYEFGRKELVHFWIGLGILRLHEHKRVEDVGLGYLDDLVNHGFLKEIKKNGGLYYVIHDLLHELAVKVSSYECLSIRSSNVKHIQIPLTIRHLSIIVDNVDVKDRASFEDYKSDLGRRLGTKLEVQNLRTLMLFGEYHGSFIKTFRALFREATAIRTILLSEASYSLEDMFQDFSKHIHLRYLRITSEWDNEICLPSALFRSYHLEVIDLEELHADFSLMTRDMSNLIKLRHFLVPRDNFELHSNIVEVGKLKFLEELRRFEVRKDTKGFELTQLGELTKLGGSLGIYNLEIVQTKEEAKEIKLLYKSHLHKLILEWGNKDVEQDANVLESLVPHENLRNLCIEGHGGANCPSWLGQNLSVKNLESLCLYDVSWNTLPPLGELGFINDLGEEFKSFVSNQTFQTLKRLELVKVPKLRKWVGNGTCCLFSRLEVVTIKYCPELVELPFSHPSHSQAEQEQEQNMRTWFPVLGELKIINCPQLFSLPPIPWTPAPCSIEIEKAGSVFQKLVYSKDDESKSSLQIVGKDGQKSKFWSGLAFHNLTDLAEFKIDNCPPLPLIRLEKLKSLKTLSISKMGNTLLLYEGESHKMESPLPVERMEISSCGANGKDLRHVLSHFPNLTYMRIERCEKITGVVLNVVEHQTMATSPSADKTEQAHRTAHQQQQTTGEEECAAAREGLLLLPPQLQGLEIWSCPNLVLSNSPGFGGGGEFQSLCSLRRLSVYSCAQFFSHSCSASSCSPFPTSLQRLSLDKVGGTEMLLPLSNLTSLTSLYVGRCGDLRGEGLWPLVAQGCLTSLHIRETPKFFSGAEPESRSSSSRLECMWIPNFTGVLTRPICRLLSSSLTELICWEDKEVERFTAEQEQALQLLTSLQKLTFYDCKKLQLLPASLTKLANLKELSMSGCPTLRSLPNDGFPSCLEKLRISRCPHIKSLPDHGLPSSLKKLWIRRCPAIKSLPSNLPSSLQVLKISSCPSIKSLAKEGLPRSLRVLDVYRDGFRAGVDNSVELRRQCHKLKGTIPIVKC